jgi:hypothetical protein
MRRDIEFAKQNSKNGAAMQAEQNEILENFNSEKLLIQQRYATETEKLQNETVANAKTAYEIDYNIKLKQLQVQETAEIDSQKKIITERLAKVYDGAELEKKVTEELETWKILIAAKYAKQKDDADREQAKITADRQAQALANHFAEELLQVGENETAKAQLILQNEEALNAQLLAMDEQMKIARFGSVEAYQAAVIESSKKIIEAEKAVTAAQISNVKNVESVIGTVADSIAGVMNTMAEDSAEYAAFQKLLAIAKVAQAVASAIALAIEAAAPGDPYTVAVRIAAAAAAAIAATATLVSTVKQISTPKAPKFAAGGTVTGAGSGTSDSITAKLSSGESVMNAITTAMFAPLLSALNQIGGGVPIQAVQASRQVLGEEMLASAFRQGIEGMPNPVVSLEEINKTQNRVNVLEVNR